jgi:Ran GTPase-activating protein (RanGAP) involved in mRNA processing and transport
MENSNEEEVGVENAWVIRKRYSDLHNLFTHLKKINSELGNIPFPGKTILPGRSVKPQVVQQRTEQLHQYLVSVLDWTKSHLAADLHSEDLPKVLSALDEFLELSLLDRKPPIRETEFSCNLLRSGWLHYLWKTKAVTHLYTGFSTVNCEVLGVLLEQNKPIEYLDLSCSSGGSLRNEGFQALVDAISKNKTGIKQLFVGEYQGHNCNAHDLQEFFQHNSTIESLIITGGISISVDDPVLGGALRISTLQVLDLSGCFKTEPKSAQILQELSSLLGDHHRIRELYLNDNFVGDSGASLLSEALKTNRSLEILSLRSAQVGRHGILKLASSLKQNSDTRLQTLIITDRPSSVAPDSPTGKEVSQGVAELIRGNSSLLRLDLSSQYLGDSTKEIVQALRDNSTLQSLALANNRFVASVILDDFFSSNKSVSDLDISDNDLLDQETDSVDLSEPPAWIKLVTRDQLLKRFTLPWLDDSMLSVMLIEALSVNTCIEYLEFSSPVFCVKAFEQFFLTNRSVKEMVNLESPPQGLLSLHYSIASSPSLRSLSWKNLSTLEARGFLQAAASTLDSFGIESLHFQFEDNQPHVDILLEIHQLLTRTL